MTIGPTAPTAWKRTSVREVVLGLYDGPHATPKPASEGPVFLGIKNITDDGRLDLSEIRHVSEEDFPRWTKRVLPQPGDIVFTYEATLNRYAIIPEGFRGCLGRRLALIRPNLEKVDTRFLYYYFFGEDWRKLISKNTLSGSTVDRIPLTHFPSFELKLPPLATQRKVASVLSAYDDLIENNTRRIEILEEMAQRIYREWFVHFRFPGHEKVEMVESELGPIPEGWRVGKLDKFILNVRKSTKAGSHLSNLPYVPIDVIPHRSLALKDFKSGSEAKSSLIRFGSNDLLFGAMRPYLYKVAIAPFDGVTRTTCFVLRPKDRSSSAYATLTLFEPHTIEYADKHSRGSTIPYAAWDGSLADMPMIEPPQDLLRKFNELVEPMLERIKVSLFRTQNLVRTRNLLLAKLISGEVSVEDLDVDPEKVSNAEFVR